MRRSQYTRETGNSIQQVRSSVKTFFEYRIAVRRGVIAIALGVLVASFTAIPTTASASTESPYAPVEGAEEHCVLDVDRDTLTCFATFTEAIAKASGGRITDAPTDPAMASADLDNQINALAEDPGPQSHIVLSISYAGTRHTGSSFTAHGHYPCSSGRGYVYKNLHDFGWGNRIRSFKSYANCRITLYEYQNCRGASKTWLRNEQPVALGAMDQRASSMRFDYGLPPQSSCY
jgi:hypothetical protein